ncbi:unnamed protein product [Spirodela intermedia]|uniref:Uncharacterized protein n=1 Tax=Spirodela intermedia TaxID=51605 RepID=A0ABN7EB94_SPIIN|nr:unnamed protein product [Spirodela intermedia]
MPSCLAMETNEKSRRIIIGDRRRTDGEDQEGKANGMSQRKGRNRRRKNELAIIT